MSPLSPQASGAPPDRDVPHDIPGAAPTRDQVAALAGVSSATVSRVFNHDPGVSPSKKDAVLLAARSLGYRPNREASTLRRSKHGRILLLELQSPLPYDWRTMGVYDYLFRAIYEGVVDTLAPSLWSLDFVRGVPLADLPATLARHRCDGILVMGAETLEEAEAVASLGLPYILCHHLQHLEGHPTWSTDNQAGGALAASWLQSRGSQRPAYIDLGADHIPAHRLRWQGFSQAWTSPPPRFDIPDPRLDQPDIPALQLFLDQYRPDALAFANDFTAARLLPALIHASRNQSWTLDRAKLVGYDHNPLITVLPLPLASIDLNLYQVYAGACQSLLNHIKQAGPIASRVVCPRLVEPLQERSNQHA